MKTLELYNGDCLEVMRNAPDSSIDAIVTDPPYGLSFMGKKWDYDVPSVEIWKECLRVLKPGGHLLAFGGTRTYHRLAVNVEDAGFEIRDQIQWLYGQGFPKSLDVSKAIDKAAGAERPIIGSNPNKRAAHVKGGAGFDKGLRGNHHFECVISPVSTGLDAYGNPAATQCHQDCSVRKSLTEMHVTAPATDSAKQWEGWGTALKPANEPIVLARKPLEKGLTVAQNVQKWGTGAINIDGCRIAGLKPEMVRTTTIVAANAMSGTSTGATSTGNMSNEGRFPANVMFDAEASHCLDEQAGQAVSRFFYVAKASTSERNQGAQKVLTWENADLNQLTDSLSQHAKGISDDTIQQLKSMRWSIVLFGTDIMDQSQKALTYTIETALKLITELRTSNYSQSSNIKESIQAAIRTIEDNGLNLVKSAEYISQSQKNTTNDATALVLGAVRAALLMLSQVRGCAKQGNIHSTVKPVKLMEYLVRLITPPNGIVLDPFMGSGTTGIAASNEGVGFIGIELSPEYFTIAENRINGATEKEPVARPISG